MKGHIRKIKYKGRLASWGYCIDIGKDSSGKRKQRVRGGFKREREAIEAMQQEIAKYHPDQPLAGESRVTFAEHFTKWMQQHGAVHWGEMTLEQNEKRGQYAIKMFGDVDLQKLTAKRIEEALSTLLMQGGTKTKLHPHGRPLSPKTVCAVAALVNQSLDKAVKWRLITRNPMEDVDRPKPRETEVMIPEPNCYEKLLNRVKGTRYLALVVFAADAGCRRGEQLALQWTDIDLNTGRVHISKAVSHTHASGLKIKTPKNGKSRKLTVSRETLDILLEHRRLIDREKALFGADYQDNNLVFPKEDGSYYSPDRVTNRISQFMREAGVNGSLHKLRHFSASVLISNGAPLPMVSKRLGHANPTITLKIYAHAMPTDDDAAAVLWSEVTGGMIARTRTPPPRQSPGPVLVTKRDKQLPKLALSY